MTVINDLHIDVMYYDEKSLLRLCRKLSAQLKKYDGNNSNRIKSIIEDIKDILKTPDIDVNFCDEQEKSAVDYMDDIHNIAEITGQSDLIEPLMILAAEIAEKGRNDDESFYPSFEDYQPHYHSIENVKFKKPRLHMATKEKNLELMHTLLEGKVDVNAVDDYNNTALHLACELGFFEGAVLLLDRGAIVDQPNDEDCTPLNHACKSMELLMTDATDVLKLLLERGANPNLRDLERENALHRAFRCQPMPTIKFFLRHGANIRRLGRNGSTMLHYAAKSFYSEPLRYLLNKNIFNINHQDRNGNTPLNMDEEDRENFMINCDNFAKLLINGGDMKIANHAGKLPMLSEESEDADDHLIGCPALNLLKKLKHLGYKANPKSLSVLHKAVFQLDDLDIRISCNKELASMKNIVVDYYPKATLYDMLVMDRRHITNYTECESIEQIYERNNRDIRKEFENYGEILNMRLRRAEERKHLLGASEQAITRLIAMKIPKRVLSHIFSYFNARELERFDLTNSFI